MPLVWPRPCLDEATKYCNTRKQFGKPIGQFQMNQDLIAQMATEIEASRLLVYKAAWVKDQGNLNNGKDVAMAKYFAGETATRCANYAMRILGAYGYSTEYPGGPPLSRCPHLHHGGRLGQHLQMDHRPGPAGIPQGQPLTIGPAGPASMNGPQLPISSALRPGRRGRSGGVRAIVRDGRDVGGVQVAHNLDKFLPEHWHAGAGQKKRRSTSGAGRAG